MAQTPPTPSWPPRGWIRGSGGIDDRHPAFAGHFPGRAILPGIAQLHSVFAMATHRYGQAFPTGLRRVKFRAPIQPWVRLDAALFPTREEGELQFELRDGGDSRKPLGSRRPDAPPDAGALPLLSEGFLLLSPARSTGKQPAPPPPRGKLPPQPPMTELLPHRAPALFVQEAIAVGAADQPSWFRGRVPKENFLVADGRASCIAAIEFAAQAAAVLDAVRAFPGQPARTLEGMLVGVREATFVLPDFPGADELRVRLQTAARGPFVNVSAQVAAGGMLLCGVELQIQVR